MHKKTFMWEWLKRILGFDKGQETEIIDDSMKYLIVGLGNVGSEYAGTRHNIGFEVVDHLANELDGNWQIATLGAICEVKHKGRTLTLLKPSTYMNRSGKAVRHWMTKKKIKKDHLLIVVDDLHLDFGQIRLRPKGGDAGHNGLKDIQQALGGTEYPRLKIGIGHNFRPGQQVDYVLGKWKNQEIEHLAAILQKATDAIKSFTTIGLKFTMDRFNKAK